MNIEITKSRKCLGCGKIKKESIKEPSLLVAGPEKNRNDITELLSNYSQPKKIVRLDNVKNKKPCPFG